VQINRVEVQIEHGYLQIEGWEVQIKVVSANRIVESANKNGVCKKSTNSQIPKILILYIMSPKNVQGKHYRRTNFIEE